MNSKCKSPRVADYDDGGRRVATAAAVNDNVLMEILLRLPAKSVIRFKLVCKHWLSLISGDRFCCLHALRRHKAQSSLLLRTRTSLFFYFNPTINGEKLLIPYNLPLPNPKIVSSCCGLMLLRCGHPQTDYYVYNPTTEQSRKIVLTHNDKYIDVMGLSLAFDPSKSTHYKIVCFRATRNRQSYQLEVYDSVSHTWNLCLEPFTNYMNFPINFSEGVHCNSSVHWNAYSTIFYIDLDKHVVRSLPLPLTPWVGYLGRIFHCHRLQESDGHLFIFSDHEAGTSMALSELQGDNPSWWFLKYHNKMSYSIGALRVIRESNNDETTSTLVAHVPGKIRAYRISDMSFQELVDLTNQPSYHENFMQFDTEDVDQFGETLALV